VLGKARTLLAEISIARGLVPWGEDGGGGVGGEVEEEVVAAGAPPRRK
jgi:hypothetical protein